MSKQFAAMEEAALKAYEEDLKRMGREADGRFQQDDKKRLFALIAFK